MEDVEEVMTLIQSHPGMESDSSRRLNLALHKYTSVPIGKYDPSSGRYIFSRRPIHDYLRNWVRGEADCIERLIKLYEMGVLAQVRQCPCGKYFFVRFPNRERPVRFHSVKCRVKFWEKSETRIKQKREKAKVRYQNHKELELGSQKAAQPKGRKI
jgi:hypothetical protein